MGVAALNFITLISSSTYLVETVPALKPWLGICSQMNFIIPLLPPNIGSLYFWPKILQHIKGRGQNGLNDGLRIKLIVAITLSPQNMQEWSPHLPQQHKHRILIFFGQKSLTPTKGCGQNGLNDGLGVKSMVAIELSPQKTQEQSPHLLQQHKYRIFNFCIQFPYASIWAWSKSRDPGVKTLGTFFW